MKGTPLLQDRTRRPTFRGYLVIHLPIQNVLMLGQALYSCSVIPGDRAKERRGHLFYTNLLVITPILPLTRDTAIGNTVAGSALLERLRLFRLAAGAARLRSHGAS